MSPLDRWLAGLGSALQGRRLALGLTQTEVGARMRPPRSATEISRWERGAAAPSVESLVALSEALGGAELPGPRGATIRIEVPRG